MDPSWDRAQIASSQAYLQRHIMRSQLGIAARPVARPTASMRSDSVETPFTYLSVNTLTDMSDDIMDGIQSLIENEPDSKTSPSPSPLDDIELLWSTDSSQATSASSVNDSSKWGSPELPIDLTGDSEGSVASDDSMIDALVEELDNVGPAVLLEPENDHASSPSRPLTPAPEPQILGASIAFDDSSLLLGESVALTDGSFLFVENVMDFIGQPMAYGRRMVQTFSLDEPKGIPKVPGELIWEAHRTSPIPVANVREICQVRFTNDRPPGFQWLAHTDLVCRLKYTLTEKPDRILESTQTTREGHKDRAVEWLTCEEVNTASCLGKTSRELREAWRGPGRTIPFGSMELPAVPAFDLEMDDTAPPFIDLDEDRNRTYTFGDAYCGAGGASCGAKKARLALTWAVDKDKHAVRTYGTNFPESLVEHAEFNMFMTNTAEDLRVDVCHTSPPCQPFSPAHTIPNQVRDELNSSCIFTSRDLIMKVRPRVITMEETFGLQGRHADTFYRVIMDFIEVGYSVRWGILDCLDYGVPQTRRRLIILAAGPGEQLPKMPSPTHGEPGTCLLPVETIFNAIYNIPDDATDHDVETLLERSRFAHRSEYDPHQPAHTLTCSGGQANYHPSGKRGLSIREAACLQTFPMDFQFCGLSRRKQVGNAVPVRFAHAIFREVVRSLRQTDEKELSQARRIVVEL